MDTLGSLVDKLTIKDIRGFHLRQMLKGNDTEFTISELRNKIRILEDQRLALCREIDQFVLSASMGKIRLRDEKLKLYNAKSVMGRIMDTESIGEAMSGLARKNLELWHLEDQAREKGAPLARIGAVKKRIDVANQQRNDLIDRIDELFEAAVRSSGRAGIKK